MTRPGSFEGLPSVHGVALALGEAGVLLRGPAGAGKTSLALALIARARAERRFARLVADDRVLLRARGGRLLMRSPGSVAGLVEVRGLGVVAEPALPEARLALIVDLDPSAPRHPDEDAAAETIQGVSTQRLVVQLEMAVEAVERAIGGLFVGAPIGMIKNLSHSACVALRTAQDIGLPGTGAGNETT